MSLQLSSIFAPYRGTKIDLKEQECLICLEPLQKNQSLVSHRDSLLHVFHRNCLQLWLQKSPSCPTCRKRIVKIQKEGVLGLMQEHAIPHSCFVISVSAFLFPTLGFLTYDIIDKSIGKEKAKNSFTVSDVFHICVLAGCCLFLVKELFSSMANEKKRRDT